jgi:hypothetical protein
MNNKIEKKLFASIYTYLEKILSRRQLRILEMRIIYGYSYDQIGREFGITHEGARYIEQRTLSQLQSHFSQLALQKDNELALNENKLALNKKVLETNWRNLDLSVRDTNILKKIP